MKRFPQPPFFSQRGILHGHHKQSQLTGSQHRRALLSLLMALLGRLSNYMSSFSTVIILLTIVRWALVSVHDLYVNGVRRLRRSCKG